VSVFVQLSAAATVDDESALCREQEHSTQKHAAHVAIMRSNQEVEVELSIAQYSFKIGKEN